MGPSGPLFLDLVEHGPHALIGGTSGAGKSELLQSIVAALIHEYPPTRLTFLFVDYKGGAATEVFNTCRTPSATSPTSTPACRCGR